MRDPRARTVATATLKAIETLASDVARLPSAARLADAAVQARVVDAVTQSLSGQLTLEGTTGLDVAAIVAATCAEVARGTIDIPRVSVTPIGAVETGFNAFVLDKPWKYALIPHDVVDENMSLEFLVRAGAGA